MRKLPTLPQADSCRTRLCTHHPPLTCGALIPHWMVSHWKLQFTNPAHRVTMKSNNIMTVTHIAQMQTNSAMKTLSLVVLIFIILCVCVLHMWHSTQVKIRGQLSGQSLSIYHVSSGHWTQLGRLAASAFIYWVIWLVIESLKMTNYQ